jgi:hypothetical protein
MHKHSAGAAGGAGLSLALVAAPALAQNFQDGSTETIWSGSFRLTGSPVHLIGPDGGPDRDGGAFRLGYGITGSFDVEAKTGFFNGFTFVGGDAHYRLLDGATSLSVRAGGHQALIRDSTDSTALDLSYVTAGLAVHVPVTGGAHGRRH